MLVVYAVLYMPVFASKAFTRFPKIREEEVQPKS